MYYLVDENGEPHKKVYRDISITPVDHAPGQFNPLVVPFVISLNRKRKQRSGIVPEEMTRYSVSLFRSCFKKW